jgi:hypothetical protein
MIDEELLKPSREMLAKLGAMIRIEERVMVENIERWGKDDKEYARQQSREYFAKVEPLRREMEAVAKVIADYYGQQVAPPAIVVRP